ncbi:MAG: fasciclin protein, partial [Adhaeribacter sp.]|nr:fasciclin protein [Adhaeribacter sp.]
MKNNYYLVKRLLVYFCLLGFPLLYLSSCQPDDEHFEMPEEMAVRIYGRLTSDPDYSTFVKGVDKAGLKDILERSGLYTAFAPTNAAWDEYLKANNYSSIESIPDTILVPLINYHFMEPMKFSFDFKEPTRYTTRANKHLSLDRQGGKFTVNGIEVIPEKMNGEAMNGAIHGIGKVLIAPPTLEQALAKRTDMKNFRQLLKTFTLRRFDARSSSDNDNDGDIDSVF